MYVYEGLYIKDPDRKVIVDCKLQLKTKLVDFAPIARALAPVVAREACLR